MPQPTHAILRGGPDGTPATWKLQPGPCDTRLKILRGNGYEHFEFTRQYAEFNGELCPVYRWSYRTYIAE
ncbi:DUF5988 family protein [Streptomyces sp. NPDC058220]|uniref:DUF5988 family protein n=1 Tax=unclassified Streptomyces TaxID=2593676 RepID=UPI00364D7546